MKKKILIHRPICSHHITDIYTIDRFISIYNYSHSKQNRLSTLHKPQFITTSHINALTVPCWFQQFIGFDIHFSEFLAI